MLEAQAGVLTRRRAVELLGRGRVDALLESGRWRQPHPGVLVAHNGPLSNTQRQWAALLYGGPGAALARNTAATLGGLRRFDSDDVHLLLPKDRHLSGRPGIALSRTRHLTSRNLARAAGPRRTTIERAAVDIATWARTNDEVREIIAASVQQRRTTAAALRRTALRLGPITHRRLILATITDVAGGAETLPEMEFTAALVRAGLPLPQRQTVKKRPDGRYYLDAEWMRYSVGAEIDGHHHAWAANWGRDLHRMNEITIGGVLLLRFPNHAVREHAQGVADQVRRALAARGWPG